VRVPAHCLTPIVTRRLPSPGPGRAEGVTLVEALSIFLNIPEAKHREVERRMMALRRKKGTLKHPPSSDR